MLKDTLKRHFGAAQCANYLVLNVFKSTQDVGLDNYRHTTNVLVPREAKRLMEIVKHSGNLNPERDDIVEETWKFIQEQLPYA